MVWHWFSRSQFSRLVQSLILAALDNGIPSLWGVFFMRNCSKTAQELPKCLLLILHTFAWEFSVDPALHRIYAHIRYIRPQEHTEWNEICDFRCSTVCDQVCDIYPPHAKDLRPEEQWCGFSPFPSTSEWIFHAQTWNHEIIMSKMHWDWNPVKVSMEKCTLFSLRISVKYEAIDPVKCFDMNFGLTAGECEKW